MLAQDALVSALEQWPKSGIPDKPGVWLMPAAKLRTFDRLRRTKLIARKHEELGRERAAEGEAAQPDLDAALNDNIACACISGKTASDVSFWHLAEVSILSIIRPLYGAKPTFVRAALQLAALKLEAKHHPTALLVGGWYCRASLVAYACCGGERTGFGYSRI